MDPSHFPYQAESPRPPRRWQEAIADPTRAQVAIALVVLVLLGLLTGFLISRGGSSSGAPAPTPTAAPTTDAAHEAASLEALLVRSAASRTQASAAVAAIGGCQDLAGSRSSLLAAAAARDELGTGLAGLSLTGLPGSPTLVADLRSAWQASSAADRAYAAWAVDLGNSCTGQAQPTPAYVTAQTADARATASKNDFLARWNPIAARFGIAPRTNAQL